MVYILYLIRESVKRWGWEEVVKKFHIIMNYCLTLKESCDKLNEYVEQAEYPLSP